MAIPTETTALLSPHTPASFARDEYNLSKIANIGIYIAAHPKAYRPSGMQPASRWREDVQGLREYSA